MPAWIQGLQAERARRPAGRHKGLRSTCESCRGIGRKRDAQGVRSGRVVVAGLGRLSLAQCMRLDDHPIAVAVVGNPGDAQGTDLELLVEGQGQGCDILRADVERPTRLGEEAFDSLGEHGHLSLLQGYRRDRCDVTRLEVKGALTRHADCPRDETLRIDIGEDAPSHAATLLIAWI